MELEQTIQTCFDKHPISFENRKQVLLHIFCLFGTGFEWENGELVNTIDNWGEFKGKLDEQGKAKQLLSIEEVALRLLYKNMIDEKDFDLNISYEQFEIRMNALKIKFKKKDMKLEDTILKTSYDIIHMLRSSHETHLKERMCKQYSPILNIPKDIKEDWLEGLNEAKKIVLDLDIHLEDIK